MDFRESSPKKSSSLWIEIERCKNQVREKKKNDELEDCLAVLLLEKFSKRPLISFGKVVINSSKEATLVVKNPLENDQIVTVEKVPEKKGFTVDLDFFEVKKLSEQTVKIVWTPNEIGNYRELITFRLDAIFCKQVILLGSAVSSLKRILQPQNRSLSENKPPSTKQKVFTKKAIKRKTPPKKHPKSNENKNQMTFIQRKSIPGLRNLTETNDQTPDITIRHKTKLANSPKATVYLRLTPDLQLRSSNSQPETVLHSCEENMLLNRNQTYVTQTQRSHQCLISPVSPKTQRASPEKYEFCSPLSESSGRSSQTVVRTSVRDNYQKSSEIPLTDRRFTYSKDDVPSLIPIHRGWSPESCIKIGSPSSTSCIKRSKIPEPVYKLKSRSRRHSDVSDYNDSLDGDRSNDFSSCTTDESETKPSTASSTTECNFKDVVVNQSYFGTEQSLQITELDYNDFCGSLFDPQSNWTEIGEKKLEEECYDEDEEDDLDSLFRLKKCSTEVKSVGKICNITAVESKRELFTDQESVKTLNSETFLMKPYSSNNWKEEPELLPRRKSRRKSGIPSLQKKFSDTEVNANVKEKCHGQGKTKRNNSKTSESSSSKERGQNKKKKVSRASQQMDSGINYRPKLTLIKPPSLNKGLTPCHPNPYAAKNIYYDEQWIEKQTQGFTRWLNFILTIPEELSEGEKNKLAAKAPMEFNRDVSFKQAPSREELAFRTYTVHRKMNQLRRKACNIYQSEAVIKVITRLEHEVENRRIAIRSDKALHADVGIKQRLVDLVMSYNIQWLRIGLETVFGQIINVGSNDTESLSQFLLNHLLNSPIIAKEYAHSTVPHLFKPGYATSLKKHTLKKFLLLVYFLDQAKENYLIEFNPCLFNIESKLKSSREILLTFSRDHLSGEGDLTKHLAYFGYKVSYVQTALDEYDFSVSNLAVDLRNGLRIARAAQLLTQNWSMMSKLRVPAVTRMQKIHNVTCVLNVLAENDTPIVDVSAKDIVNGHREKTLNLLWQLIFNFQVKLVLSEEKLKHELTILEKSLQSKGIEFKKYANIYDKMYPEEKIELLLRWCRLVCAHYKIMVDNFTVSFSDGRVICYLIHYYHPNLLTLKEINNETTQSYVVPQDSISSDDSFNANWTTSLTTTEKQEQLLKNEQENFKIALSKIVLCGGVPLMIKPSLMSNTIPDEKVTMVFVSYLCARFVDLSAEIRAAKVIQKAWCKYRARSLLQKELQIKTESAIKIQQYVRNHFNRPQMKIQIESAIKIQQRFRTHLTHKKFMKTKQDVIKLQACIKGFLTRKTLKKKIQSAVIIQKWTRMYLIRKNYLQLNVLTEAKEIFKENATISTIQKALELFYLVKQLREKRAARIIKKALKSYLKFKKIEELNRLDFLLQEAERDAAATSIQSFWRMHSAKTKYELKRNNIVKIQAKCRGYLTRKKVLLETNAIVFIQRWYRICINGRQTRARFLEMKMSALKIQNWYRCSKEAIKIRESYLQVKYATLAIQNWYRSCKKTEVTHLKFFCIKISAILIQQWYRRAKKAKQQREKFLKIKQSVIIIQQWYRRSIEYKRVRMQFLDLRRNVLLIQMWYRTLLSVRKYRMQFLDLKQKVILIQQWYRRSRETKEIRARFLIQKQAVIYIQQWYRLSIEVRKCKLNFMEVKQSVVIIQHWYRRCRESNEIRERFLKQKQAVICIQQWYRSFLEVRKCKQNFLKMKRSVSLIQQWYRRSRESNEIRERFLKQKQTFICIQQWYRSSIEVRKCKRNFLEMKRSVSVIQQWYRRFRDANEIRKQFLKQKQAVIFIQQWYRSSIEVRKCKLNFLEMKRNVSLIQQWYRRSRDTKKIRERFLKQKQAIICIQQWYRSSLEVRKCKRNFLEMKRCISLIQQWYRRSRDANEIREQFLKQKQAVIYIQQWYRLSLEVWKCKLKFLKMKRTVSLIQQWYRRSRETNEIRARFLKQKQAIIYIQQWYRRSKEIIETRARFLKQKQAVIYIQQWYRRSRETNETRARFLKQKQAVIYIQQWYRRSRETNETRAGFLKQKQAVIYIQQWYRRSKETNETRARFLKQKQAVIYIQQWYRSSLEVRKCKRNFLEMKRSVVSIQRWYRHCKETKLIRQEILKLKQAVVTILNWYRWCMEAKKIRMEFLKKKKAAIIIQQWYRHFIEAKKIRLKFLKAKRAMFVIQQWYRCLKEAKKIRTSYLEIRQNVIILQQLYRRCKETKKCRTRLIKMKQTIIYIQQWYRRMKNGQKQRMEFIELKQKTIFIQQWYRRCKVVKIDRGRYLKLKQAVVFMQNRYRSIIVMRKHRERFLCLRRAVINIQLWYRRCKETEITRHNFLEQKHASICIQRWYRSCKIARTIRADYLDFLDTVVMIQKWFRSCVQTKKTRHEFIKLRLSAIDIQRWYRRSSKAKKQREEFLKLKRVAITIQKWYNFSKEAQKNRQEIRVWKSVCKIQEWYRRCKQSEKIRLEFLKMKNSSIIIQCRFRNWKEMKRNREELLELKHSAVCIQKWYRKCTENRKFRMMFLEKKWAAIIIQKWFKSRLSFLRMNSAAVVIQKWFRNWSEVKKIRLNFLRLKSQVVYIEEWYLNCKEGKRLRDQFLKFKKSIVIIQRFYKWCIVGKKLREEFLIIKRAVTTLQSYFRCWLQQKKFKKMKVAAVVIQRAFRKFKLDTKMKAVVILQKFITESLKTKKARSEFLKFRSAAIVLQKHYRMWKRLKDFKLMKMAVQIIESNYKNRLVRKKRINSACVLQGFIRECLQVKRDRRAFLRIKLAVVVIQSWFRMCRCQRNFILIKKSVVIIQKNYRMIKCRHEFESTKSAAFVIQKNYRCKLYQAKFLKIKKSVLLIQKTWRGYVDRICFVNLKACTICLQSAWRRYVERKKYLITFIAIVTIQNWYRGYREVILLRTKFVKKKSATVKIQRWFRSRLAVKKYKQIQRSILGIQKYCRMKIVMMALYNKVWAIEVLQVHWLAVSKGKKIRKKFLVIKCAAIVIQNWFRMLKCQREFMKKKKSAIKIQKVWKMIKARRMFLLQKQSVLILEDWVWSCWERRIIRESYLVLKSGVIRLQYLWRRYKNRNIMKIANNAATTIQNWYFYCQLTRFCRAEFLELKYYVIKMQAIRRGTVARQNLFYMHEAAIVIQSSYRKWIVRNNFQLVRGCAIVIQRFWRNCQLTRVLNEEYLLKKTACVILQAFIRGSLIRRRYLFLKYSTILIQSFTRGSLIRRKFFYIKSSVIFIQRCWRRHLLQRRDFTDYHVLRGAVIVIQSYLRGYYVRKLIKSGAVKRTLNFSRMSSFYDDLLLFKKWKDYHIVRGAVITIQAWTRGWFTRKSVFELRQRKRNMAAIKLQAAIRGVLTRRKLEKERCVCWKFRCNDYVNFAHCRRLQILNAVRNIERFYQCYKLRQIELMSEEDLVIKVKKYSKWTKRLLTQRRWFLLMRIAAIIIQNFWRAWVLGTRVRCRFLVLKFRMVKFQAVSRGCLLRKMLQKKREYFKRERIKLQAVQEFYYVEEKIASRENYLKCFAAAAKMQLSAVVLQRWIRNCYMKKMNKYATVIQAAWKGYRLRSAQIDRRFSDVRSRVNEANQSAVLEDTLWHRTSSGLDSLFNCRKLSTVWKALNNLNTSTRLSPVCCERLANSGGIAIIYQLIDGCNRSVPHMEVITECLCILVNLAKHEPSRTQVWQLEDCGITIVKLMRNYFEKKEKIVLKCCSLMWIISQDKSCVKQFREDEIMKKCIGNLCTVVNRRFVPRGPSSESSPIVTRRRKLLARYSNVTFKPDWVLGNDIEREFCNYVKAFPLVIELMQSWL